MNDGKVIVQVNPVYASANVKFIRLPSSLAKLLRKSLEALNSSATTLRNAVDTASPYITGAASLAIQNKWVIVSAVLLYRIQKRGRKSSAPRVVQAQGTLTDEELSELKALTPSQVSAVLHEDELSYLVDSLNRVVIDRADLIATELVAIPFFQKDQKLARQQVDAKRHLLSTVCGQEGFETLIGRKWELIAAWRQQLATTTEAVDMGLQRASFAQEVEWKDIRNWQKKLKLLEAEQEQPQDDQVKRSDPTYVAYQKWEAVIG